MTQGMDVNTLTTWHGVWTSTHSPHDMGHGRQHIHHMTHGPQHTVTPITWHRAWMSKHPPHDTWTLTPSHVHSAWTSTITSQLRHSAPVSAVTPTHMHSARMRTYSHTQSQNTSSTTMSTITPTRMTVQGRKHKSHTQSHNTAGAPVPTVTPIHMHIVWTWTYTHSQDTSSTTASTVTKHIYYNSVNRLSRLVACKTHRCQQFQFHVTPKQRMSTSNHTALDCTLVSIETETALATGSLADGSLVNRSRVTT